jgi:hypothetical protein
MAVTRVTGAFPLVNRMVARYHRAQAEGRWVAASSRAFVGDINVVPYVPETGA